MRDQEHIIARARRGDADAFEQLVAAYRNQVFRLALRMCGNEADADEVAQEAFLSAWKGLPNFRGESRFSTWLYQLTTHAAIDLMRREKRQAAAEDIDGITAADDGPSPQQQVERAETRREVRSALMQLPEEYRQVLLLRFMQELDYGEIARALNVSEGTVKSRINRAKSKLREVLAAGNFFDAGLVLPTEETERREQP